MVRALRLYDVDFVLEADTTGVIAFTTVFEEKHTMALRRLAAVCEEDFNASMEHLTECGIAEFDKGNDYGAHIIRSIQKLTRQFRKEASKPKARVPKAFRK